MSFPTQPAFVFRGNWSDYSRQHPAMKFMEEYTYNFDAKKYTETKWYTDDFSLCQPDGTEVHGRDKAIAAVQQLFGPFVAHYHEPFFCVTTETDEGWEMIGQATLHANLPGNPAADEKKVSDPSGRKWDISGPGAERFQYVKTEGGVLLKRIEIMSDSAGPMKVMIKRGLIGPKDLGL